LFRHSAFSSYCTLSLHDALPISMVENAGTIIVDTPDETAEVMAFYRGAMPALGWTEVRASATQAVFETDVASLTISLVRQGETRSEEHTSELQSRENLVCRLLLE